MGLLGSTKEKADDQNLRAEFRIGDAENISFDAVINRYLLRTPPDPKRAVSEWKRVLRPGGKVLIIDSIRDDFNSLCRPIRRYLVSMPRILITERRNPCRNHYDREIEKQLPMRSRKRPEADVINTGRIMPEYPAGTVCLVLLT